MEQRTIDDNRMGIAKNQLYFPPLRPYDDGLMVSEDVEGKYILKVGVHETRLTNEVWLDIWYPDSEVTQHVHYGACETFYIIDGEAKLIVTGGVETVLKAGDIFHCPAALGHEFHTLGEHMAWYNLFSNLHYWNIIQTEIDMSVHNPQLMRDVPYYRRFISSMNSLKLDPYPPVLRHETPPQVRRAGEALLTYEALGLRFGLKVAPWETNNVNEVWEIGVPDGTRVKLAEPFNFWQTYIVTAGELECVVGEDSFTAGVNDIVQIYPHKPFDLRARGDVTVLSWGSGYKLIRALDAAVYARTEDPAALADPAAVAAFQRDHEIPVVEVTR
jgi:mannose-6-phosphate isomerase-like protein (cupin superfamily)